MSFLSVVPDRVATASANLANIGSTLRSANAAAATQTTGIMASAADEVSAAIAAVFDTHGQGFQTVGAQAAAFHDEFVSLVNGSAAQYLSTEIANAQQSLAGALNTPVHSLLGNVGSAAAAANPGAANPAASNTSTQSFSTPFGPITLSTTVNVPSNGTGPTSIAMNASTPIGGAQLSLSGTMATAPILNPPSIQQTTSFTSGTLVLPPVFPLLLGAVGPYVTGGISLYNSGHTFVTALSHWDFLGAAKASVTAPFDYTNAVLFGQDTVNVPLGMLDAGSSANGATLTWGIPFSGVFAHAAPMTLSWPQYSYTDTSTLTPTTTTITGANIAFSGTQFGGIGTQLLNAIGIRI